MCVCVGVGGVCGCVCVCVGSAKVLTEHRICCL